MIASITAEDSRFLPVIFDLFINAPTWPDERRNVHAIKWRLADGTELAFHGAFGEWSEYDGMWSFDWYAAAAATVRWVQAAAAGQARDVTPPVLLPFAEIVSQARAESRMSRPRLAGRSGVSVATIAAYEHGRRAPSREALVALCRALTIDGYTTNRLLREASLEEEPSDWALWLSGDAPISIWANRDPLRALPRAAIFGTADGLEWPAFVLDGACHIVHANPLARRVVDLGRWKAIPGRPGPHLMQLMVSSSFREQVRNWETVAGVVLPGRLEVQLLGNTGERSSAGLRAVAEHLRRTEAGGLAALFDIWEHSEGFDSLRRTAVRLEWTTEAGDELAFNTVFSNWNAYDPYKAMDLFPADEATFAWLNRG